MPYDKEKANRAVKFFHKLKHTKGKWHGVPFELLPWQEKIVRDIFGTVKENGYRQYNYAYIEVPKKNGKSELAAGFALQGLCADGEWAAEVYGCAADRRQASIVFDVAVDMVDQWPALKKKCKLVISQKRIIYLPTKSFYQVLSAEAYTKHGLNVHRVVFDELHAQPTRKLYDIMTKGSGDARTQPLFFIITTAGDDPDRQSIGWEVHEYARKVLSGDINDPTFYAVIYGVDEDDDWEDEENWWKANPSLGITIDIDKVRAAYLRAKNNPAEERLFRQLRLNQWVKYKSTKWVPLEAWDATAGLVIPEKLYGRKCFGGLDLSSKIDISAFKLLFPPTDDDPVWRSLSWFWIPIENMKERVKRDGVRYDEWVRQGLIKATDGNSIDYNVIEQDIIKLGDLYDIQEIGYDPWNAYQMAQNLTEKGMIMAEVRQGYKSMSEPMKYLEGLILDQKYHHGGNPVDRWMFGNLEVKKDENENIRPVKDKQGKNRIDGIVALINAMARAILHEKEEEKFPGIIFL